MFKHIVITFFSVRIVLGAVANPSELVTSDDIVVNQCRVRRKVVGEKGKRDLNLLAFEDATGKDGGEGEEVAEEVDDDEEGAKADVFVVVVGGKVEVAVTE